MIFTEINKIVNALPPIDGDNGAVVATDIISMKGFDHATFIMTFGVVDASSHAETGTGSESNLILNKGENVTTCATPMIARYRAEMTANGDTLEALTTLPLLGVSMGTGLTLDMTGDNAIIVVEVDAADLLPTAANPYDTIKLSWRFSNHSIIMSCVCILSKTRYQGTDIPSAITN